MMNKHGSFSPQIVSRFISHSSGDVKIKNILEGIYSSAGCEKRKKGTIASKYSMKGFANFSKAKPFPSSPDYTVHAR